MTNPSAITLVWIGPSDRPSPPIMLWSDATARDAATAWLRKRGGLLVGASEIEVPATALACIARDPNKPGAQPFLLEVTSFAGDAPGLPVRLGTGEAKSFLDAAIGCVGSDSTPGGYLRSLRTLVENAGK
ncbi:MAG: hypothetical protein U0570_02075 [Phycisphaerales bacterium]